VASIAVTIVVAVPFGNAIVTAGSEDLRQGCGTAWEPNAVTTACADALKARSWTAIALFGVALLGALAAVLVAARWPASVRSHLAIVGLAVASAVVIAGLLRAGVIDRTVGS
jgi:hypothetical protein